MISYKPGGGGAVGWSQLNSMGKDGYTMMGINLPHIIIKPRQKDVGFKTDDIDGFYIFHYTPDAIVVHRMPVEFKISSKNVIDLRQRANPGKLTMSGSGKGTANHLAQITFDKLAGTKTTYVAFKGTGASVQALLGNQVKGAMGVHLCRRQTRRQGPPCSRLPWKSATQASPTFRHSRNSAIDIVSGAYRGIAVPKGTPARREEETL